MGILFLMLALGAIAIGSTLTGLELDDRGYSGWANLLYVVALLCVIAIWFVNEIT